MGLLESLVIGSYIYTTAFGAFLYKLIAGNHLKHLERRVSRLEQIQKYGEVQGE